MSNVIKPSQYVALDDRKTIEFHELALLLQRRSAGAAEDPANSQEVADAEKLAGQILQDAESEAQQMIRQAAEEIARLKEEAQAEIDRWWEERRSNDEQLAREAEHRGYQAGYDKGLAEAERAIYEQYAAMIAEAQDVLRRAHSQKAQIIREAEPFLIELSIAVAEKIVDRQLTVSREWIVDLIRKLLSRTQGHRTITLCVSPKQFDLVQNAREELLQAVDSQAELVILPDAGVKDHGCIIRTAFGSIDGRIDTQLKELKNALLQIAAQNEGLPSEDENS